MHHNLLYICTFLGTLLLAEQFFRRNALHYISKEKHTQMEKIRKPLGTYLLDEGKKVRR